VANISITEKSRDKLLHIEAPGCIINIRVGLKDRTDRAVTSISISADGTRYAGQTPWWVEGEQGKDGIAVRVIEGIGAEASKPEPSGNVTKDRYASLAALLGPAAADEVLDLLNLGVED
jgi:hypothetical protein